MNVKCVRVFYIKMVVVTCTSHKHKWEQSMSTYISAIYENTRDNLFEE